MSCELQTQNQYSCLEVYNFTPRAIKVSYKGYKLWHNQKKLILVCNIICKTFSTKWPLLNFSTVN